MANKGLYGSPTGRKEGAGTVFNYTNRDKDLSLSVADMGKTININTPNNYGVQLPDARQLASTLMTIITNNHATQFINVKDNNGFVVKTVMPMQSVVFWATSNATSGGVWIAKKLGGGVDLTNSNVSVGSSVAPAIASARKDICALSATQAICAFSSAGTSEQAMVLTSNGSSITNGTVTNIGTAPGDSTSICQLSATQAILLYLGVSYYATAVILTVSGSTISVGSPFTVFGGGSGNLAITAISATQAIAFYYNTTSYPTAVVLNISGTTISAGTPVVIASISSSGYSIAALSATKAITMYHNGSSNLITNILTVSGSTISVGASTTAANQYSINNSIRALSSSQAIAFYTGSSSQPSAVVLTISGTSITAGIDTVTSSATSTTDEKMCVLSSNQAMVIYSNGNPTNYPFSQVLTVTGNGASATVIAGSATSLGNISSYYYGICSLTSNQALAVIGNPSGYPATYQLNAY